MNKIIKINPNWCDRLLVWLTDSELIEGLEAYYLQLPLEERLQWNLKYNE